MDKHFFARQAADAVTFDICPFDHLDRHAATVSSQPTTRLIGQGPKTFAYGAPES